MEGGKRQRNVKTSSLRGVGRLRVGCGESENLSYGRRQIERYPDGGPKNYQGKGANAIGKICDQVTPDCGGKLEAFTQEGLKYPKA